VIELVYFYIKHVTKGHNCVKNEAITSFPLFTFSHYVITIDHSYKYYQILTNNKGGPIVHIKKIANRQSEGRHAP